MLYASPGSTLDCTGAVALECNQTVASSTVGGPASALAYPCGPVATYDGPERVFTLNNPTDQTVSLLLGGAAPDLDVILINADPGAGGGCAETACVDLGADRVIAYNLPAGDYYVVVDGRNGYEGPFDLTSVCGASMEPSYVMATLDPNDADPSNDCIAESKTAYLNPDVFQADVLFTIDITFSQADAIEALKTWSREIIDRMNESIDDVRFALVSYRDYPGSFTSCGYSDDYRQPTDYPYRLELAMTNDIASLTTAINSLEADGGADSRIDGRGHVPRERDVGL